jgi:hypothetical protein
MASISAGPHEFLLWSTRDRPRLKKVFPFTRAITIMQSITKNVTPSSASTNCPRATRAIVHTTAMKMRKPRRTKTAGVPRQPDGRFAQPPPPHLHTTGFASGQRLQLSPNEWCTSG